MAFDGGPITSASLPPSGMAPSKPETATVPIFLSETLGLPPCGESEILGQIERTDSI